jgi:hypothetical protein
MPDDVRFRTMARYLVGVANGLDLRYYPVVHLATLEVWLSHLLVRTILG